MCIYIYICIYIMAALGPLEEGLEGLGPVLLVRDHLSEGSVRRALSCWDVACAGSCRCIVSTDAVA